MLPGVTDAGDPVMVTARLGVAAVTVRVYVPETTKGDPVPVELSLADTVKLTTPGVFGVPDSTPFEKLSPAGIVPELIVREE
jgi:hypothetical protein